MSNDKNSCFIPACSFSERRSAWVLLLGRDTDRGDSSPVDSCRCLWLIVVDSLPLLLVCSTRPSLEIRLYGRCILFKSDPKLPKFSFQLPSSLVSVLRFWFLLSTTCSLWSLRRVWNMRRGWFNLSFYTPYVWCMVEIKIKISKIINTYFLLNQS